MSQEPDTTNDTSGHCAMERERAWIRCTQMLLYLWRFASYSAWAYVLLAVIRGHLHAFSFCMHTKTPTPMCDTSFDEYLVGASEYIIQPLMWFAVAWCVGVLTALVCAIGLVGTKDITIVIVDLWCGVCTKMAKLCAATYNKFAWVTQCYATFLEGIIWLTKAPTDKDDDPQMAQGPITAKERERAWTRCTQTLLYLWYFVWYSAWTYFFVAIILAECQAVQICRCRVTRMQMCDTTFVQYLIGVAKLAVQPLMWFTGAWCIGVLTALGLAIKLVGTKDITIVMLDSWCYVRAKMLDFWCYVRTQTVTKITKLRTALCDRLTWVNQHRATLAEDIPCPTNDKDNEDNLIRFIMYASFLTSVLVLAVVVAVRNLPEPYLLPATVAVASTIRQGAWALLMVLLSFISMGTLFSILFVQTIINAALPVVRFFAVSICITCFTAFGTVLFFEVTGALSAGTTAKIIRAILIDRPNIYIAYMQSFCIAVVYGALRIPRKQTDGTHSAAAATTVLAASKEE